MAGAIRSEAKMVKQVAKTGCNVLLVQKSILRDAVTDLSLDFCAKAKIMVVKDIERDDIEFISKILGVEAAATLDTFTPDKLAKASLVHEESLGTELGSIVRFTGLQTSKGGCVSVLVRASNQMLLDETERSIHDALCVVRSLVKKKALIAGGAAPEMEVAQKLEAWARTVGGITQVCIEHYAEALELVPYTLAENAGMQPVEIVTQLRAAHANGEKFAGINVKKSCISNMFKENVVQPLLVSTSAMNMATETVRMILKIDDIVIASYKPGDDVKLGLDAAQLRAQAPRLIYAQITGYGLNDPRTGYDAVIQAESGFTFMNGAAAHQGGSPTKMPVALVDLVAAHQLKEAILLALFNRERFGEGAHVHVSLMAAAVASLANQATGYLITGEVPQRMGSDHPSICPYGTAFSDQDEDFRLEER
ncbi:cct4 [Symbiodinium sp. KB8]|nr:cct4 [Symbiodinium sp. KB8]